MRGVRTLLALTVLLLLMGSAVVQSGGGYDLSWWRVGGGGQTLATGGGYSLDGTTGQAEAGVLTGGEYTLGGGFWGGGETPTADYRIYLPLVLRRS